MRDAIVRLFWRGAVARIFSIWNCLHAMVGNCCWTAILTDMRHLVDLPMCTLDVPDWDTARAWIFLLS